MEGCVHSGKKEVASEPVLRGLAAVDAALRDLKECQYALTELGVSWTAGSTA